MTTKHRPKKKLCEQCGREVKISYLMLETGRLVASTEMHNARCGLQCTGGVQECFVPKHGLDCNCLKKGAK